MSAPDPILTAVRVWDLPTRLFHWLLVLAVVGSITCAKIGGAAMAWHFRFGYFILALLAFRLLWGIVGGHWSRFANFIYSPGAVMRYLRGQSRGGDHHEVGHSPLGGLSVFALLALLTVQVGTGLVADDEIANVGPLNRFVSADVASAATGWHKEYGEWLLWGLIGLHVLAVLIYQLVKKRDLLGPMVGGNKRLPPGTPASTDSAGTRLLALVLLALALALSGWVSRQGG